MTLCCYGKVSSVCHISLFLKLRNYLRYTLFAVLYSKIITLPGVVFRERRTLFVQIYIRRKKCLQAFRCHTYILPSLYAEWFTKAGICLHKYVLNLYFSKMCNLQMWREASISPLSPVLPHVYVNACLKFFGYSCVYNF